MPPIPPIPPPVGTAGSSLGISVITASAVVSSEATPEASVIAVRTTYKIIKNIISILSDERLNAYSILF